MDDSDHESAADVGGGGVPRAPAGLHLTWRETNIPQQRNMQVQSLTNRSDKDAKTLLARITE